MIGSPPRGWPASLQRFHSRGFAGPGRSSCTTPEPEPASTITTIVSYITLSVLTVTNMTIVVLIDLGGQVFQLRHLPR